jgi:hypothetical protein
MFFVFGFFALADMGAAFIAETGTRSQLITAFGAM